MQWLKFYHAVCELTHMRLFKSVLILENFVKRGYMHLNKRTRATIRDVLLFDVVRYMYCDLRGRIKENMEALLHVLLRACNEPYCMVVGINWTVTSLYNSYCAHVYYGIYEHEQCGREGDNARDEYM